MWNWISAVRRLADLHRQMLPARDRMRRPKGRTAKARYWDLIAPFLLRIDPTVLDALQRWANDDLRSLNAQIEFVLRRAAQQAGRLKDEDTPRKP